MDKAEKILSGQWPTKNPKWIYESPDKGKTIYRREFGNYNKRELIKVRLFIEGYLVVNISS